jgi:hypothetical protein
METFDIAKQMIDLQKSTFKNTFNAMAMVQEQTEKVATTFMDQIPGLPKEGKETINFWMKAYKQGQDDFKKAAEENYRRMEEFFGLSK